MVEKEGYGSAAPVNVEVVAPETLNAGYTFDAVYQDVTFTVTVPEGGVSKGQKFIVPFEPPTEATAVAASPINDTSATIPTGHWRDGLFDCFRFGCCHPHFCNSWCFQPFIIGQILTRMKMTWLGRRTIAVDESWRKTFRNLAAAAVVYYVLMALTQTSPEVETLFDDVDDDDLNNLKHMHFIVHPPTGIDLVKQQLHRLIQTGFGLYIIYLLVQLRAAMRHTYSIPEKNCLFLYGLGVCSNERDGVCGDNTSGICTAGVPVGWEDIFCAIWCQLCVIGQMARHTSNYQSKQAVCCNPTGVSEWEDDEAYEGVSTEIGEGSGLV